MAPVTKMSSNVTEDRKQKCITELRQMVLDDKNLSKLELDDEYILRFLNSTDFDVVAAFTRMKTFYEILEQHPEWFTISNPIEKRNIIEKNITIITGEYDKEGRPLYIVKLGNMDPSSMDLLKDVVAVEDIYAEVLLLNYPSYCSQNGLCVIIDISNFSIKIMKWLTPSYIRTAIKRIQSMPIKEIRFHVINSSFLIQAAIKVVWPFLPQSMKESVSFHFNDRNSFYQYVDKDTLPFEYGGLQDNTYNNYHNFVYNKNSEVAESFKNKRELYLKHVLKNAESKKR